MSNPLGAGASSGGPEGRSCECVLKAGGEEYTEIFIYGQAIEIFGIYVDVTFTTKCVLLLEYVFTHWCSMSIIIKLRFYILKRVTAELNNKIY